MPSTANLGPSSKCTSKLVRDGQSRSEVLRESVRLVEEREKRLASLDAALAQGIVEAEAGVGIPLDEAKQRLHARYQAKAKAFGA